MNQIIELMVNRQILKIPAKRIIYASVTDKLCKIYLDSQEPLSLFVTISDLMEKLGEEDFLRVSRSSLVAYEVIEAVSKDEVVLHGNIRVPYSRSRRKEIADKVKAGVGRLAACRDIDREIMPLNFQQEFEFWNKVPIAFGVLEFIMDEAGGLKDFIFRYANQELAKVEETTVDKLLSLPFGKLFPRSSDKWFALYSKVAFQGEVLELMEHSEALNKDLLIICYQPAYGYCACIVADATNKYFLQIKQYLA